MGSNTFQTCIYRYLDLRDFSITMKAHVTVVQAKDVGVMFTAKHEQCVICSIVYRLLLPCNALISSPQKLGSLSRTDFPEIQ
jgi:hypothetical protein